MLAPALQRPKFSLEGWSLPRPCFILRWPWKYCQQCHIWGPGEDTKHTGAW